MDGGTTLFCWGAAAYCCQQSPAKLTRRIPCSDTFVLFCFPLMPKNIFYWRPEFITQVEQKKAGLKMEIEPNQCFLV